MTELQRIEEQLATIGTYRVTSTDVFENTTNFEHQSLDKPLPELVLGQRTLCYSIMIKVTPHAKES